MTLEWADLPPDMRRRLAAKFDLPHALRKPKVRRETHGHLHLRCHDCELEFRHITGPDGYETHSDATRHRRFECVL